LKNGSQEISLKKMKRYRRPIVVVSSSEEEEVEVKPKMKKFLPIENDSEVQKAIQASLKEKSKEDLEIEKAVKASLSEKKKEKEKNKNECTICCTNEINCTFDPCGHVFCTQCSKNTKICFNCRKPIKKVIKIFF